MDMISAYVSAAPFSVLIFLGLTVIFSIDSMRNGSGRAIALAFALFAATVLHSFTHTTIGIAPFISSAAVESIFYVVLVVLLYFFARRMGIEYIGSSGHVLSAIISGIALTCIVIVVLLSIPLFTTYFEFGNSIQIVMAEKYRFYWLLGALAALALARG